MRDNKKIIMYADIKGNRYNKYQIQFEGNSDLIAIEEEFETFDRLIEFVYQFSNTYTIPVQFLQ